MIDEFEELRLKLHKSIEENGLHSEKTFKISERYNKLVNLHYQNERQYRENNIMYENYKESVKSLRKLTEELIDFPTIKVWNCFAKENNLLNSESIKYISGSSWHGLRNRIYPKR